MCFSREQGLISNHFSITMIKATRIGVQFSKTPQYHYFYAEKLALTLVTTGDFYGIIHSINGLLFVLITGKMP